LAENAKAFNREDREEEIFLRAVAGHPIFAGTSLNQKSEGRRFALTMEQYVGGDKQEEHHGNHSIHGKESGVQLGEIGG